MRAVVLILLVSSVAEAQPSLTEPQPIVMEHQKPRPPEYKRPATATALAIGGSLVGLGTVYLGHQMGNGDKPIMVLGGLISVVGPSSGDWWASSTARFTPGFGVRLAGAAIAGVGLARNTSLADNHSLTLIGVGGVTVLAGMALDVGMAGPTAHEHNARFHLGPQIVRTTTGNAPGLGVGGQF